MLGVKTMLSQNKSLLSNILDTPESPVGKMRLLSGGISPNNLLESENNLEGQKACLACGNCVDTCPVILRELDCVEFQPNRNSLYLETVVAASCLRCYQCIQACPQVDRGIKLTAARHRVTERILHWWLGIAYLLTSASGIALNHFRDEWSSLFLLLVSSAHKTGAVMWLLVPVLFLLYDSTHFSRTLKAVVSWNSKDFAWWQAFLKSVFTQAKRPFEGEYNSGQKTWYLVLLGTMLVLGVTGFMRWLGEGSMTETDLNLITYIHIAAALVIDISFAYHFGRKLLMRAYRRGRHIFRDSYSYGKQS
ncbi:MAG: cytochrome b/b6 domain-containing protein [Sporomusaceae bacterium]|jgi:cytochrome b subunit of formate dehydrogenase/NAD-dependent dihydropyrimidine dehydrogenase PreA subunit|nr:cytochrome b/b6 domain-containing protein [Sporomusaceae bacterium]